MNVKDYVFGVLAGFNLIALWYVQLFLNWLHFDYNMLIFVYPILPAALLILLVKHKRMKYLLSKIGLAMLFSIIFGYLTMWLNLGYTLLNIAIPGYGRLSAGGGFAVMLLTKSYLIYNGIAVLVPFYFIYSKKMSSKRKRI